jgi:hypothetical protein
MDVVGRHDDERLLGVAHYGRVVGCGGHDGLVLLLLSVD